MDDVQPITASSAIVRAGVMIHQVLTNRDLDWRDRDHLLEEATYRLTIAADQVAAASKILSDMAYDLYYGDGTTAADEIVFLLRLLTGGKN